MKTDLEIQKDVLTELMHDPHIHAGHIGVEVSNGVVTLSGHVESYYEKWKAEKATKQVKGVNALAQEIKVILPGSSTRSDSEISYQIQSLINWSNINPDNNIKAKVEAGFITLSGTVESHSQKELVQHLIANLIGITGICSLINVEPKLSIPLVKKDITDSFRRQAIDEANNLDIAIDNNIVTLSGKVHSWSERNSAVNAAWTIPSVKNVVDKIQIVN
ncbi:BON domain-containing protein [Polynucleobacter sp. 71A-WALBACH]|uniref:BON domain-containing protein n=1 Tax=Polynucleobacter sp. 71A-WALBACH TaxID=2689097 RepID=UPI001C0C0B6E|nr:BON domain-containing protein [Polynucleobacter sp. 71A-WALBACH]MBU3593665.1 BON domain-containing protein [Polynucleobacter sp. 71A-WALBACH]